MTDKNDPGRLPAERPSDVGAKPAAAPTPAPQLGDRTPGGSYRTGSGAFPKLVQDPGSARKLPPPIQQKLHGGERVRLTKAQTYADRRIEAGAEGVALHPSSQAACWVVFFIADGTTRVVPGWDLTLVGPVAVAH